MYVNENMEKIIRDLEKWMDEKEEGICTLVGSDFNARTGEKKGKIEMKDKRERGIDEERRSERKSKDKKMDKEGRMMVQ